MKYKVHQKQKLSREQFELDTPRLRSQWESRPEPLESHFSEYVIF